MQVIDQSPCSALRRVSKSALVVILLISAALASLTSCTNTIISPANPREPVSVFLLDHGRTPSLVLPIDEQTSVRYAYGDWEYYALRKNDLWHGIAAFFWPTQGTLGRKQFAAAANRNGISQTVGVGAEYTYELRVEKSKNDELRNSLDQLFDANRNSMIINEPYDLEFVHHPTRYTMFHNSNHEMADWLRQLGCEVRGPAFNSKWRFEQRDSRD
jgi:hypothetical protein